MNYVKQLALVLTLITSACTVQAAPQRAEQNFATVVNNWGKMGAAAFLAYLTVKHIPYDKLYLQAAEALKQHLGYSFSETYRRRGILSAVTNESDYCASLINNHKLVTNSARFLSVLIAFRVYKNMLDRTMG